MFNPMALTRKLIWNLRVKNDFWGRCKPVFSRSGHLHAAIEDASVLAGEFEIIPRWRHHAKERDRRIELSDPGLVLRKDAQLIKPLDIVSLSRELCTTNGVVNTLLLLANKTKDEVFRVIKHPKGTHVNFSVGNFHNSGVVEWRLNNIAIQLFIDDPLFYTNDHLNRDAAFYKAHILIRRNGVAYHHSLSHVKIEFRLERTTDPIRGEEIRLRECVVDSVTGQPLRMEVIDVFRGVLKNAEDIYVNPSKNKTYQKHLQETYRV